MKNYRPEPPTFFLTISPPPVNPLPNNNNNNNNKVTKPTFRDISNALVKLGLRHVVQPYKFYPRDIESHWDNPGRVMVELVDDVTEVSLGKLGGARTIQLRSGRLVSF